MVSYGNMDGPNLDTYYSSVISLQSMRNIFFLDELDDINICTSDIRNSYLTARTSEKIVFNTGPGLDTFGHAGHFILIKSTLYGLKSSGARSHSLLLDALKYLGFVPSTGGYDIWMHDESD